MTVFADTSAFYAHLDKQDQYHAIALGIWTTLAQSQETVISTNYVLVETMALVGRRIGLQSVRSFLADFVPLIQVHWVDEDLHQRAVSALLTVGERHLSLVDCVSFEVMRSLGFDTVFTFDAHFADQGFRCLP